MLTLGTGAAAGFATMTANAAGPVTTVYLIRAGLPMLQMIGTGAWFYLVVNLAKVPFSAGLGLITPTSLVLRRPAGAGPARRRRLWGSCWSDACGSGSSRWSPSGSLPWRPLLLLL